MRDKTTEETCEEFEVDESTIKRWIERGLPCDREGRGVPRLFDFAEVAAWKIQNNVTGEAGRPAETDDALKAAKTRKELALAEKHEIELARVKGLLVDKAVVESANIQKFTVIRNKFLGLAASIAPMLEGQDPASIEVLLDQRIREILEELSRT
jgi:phage terminase Nu1 subunit (DNA packaging protein)